jgi:hypothetical protein
MRTNAKRNWKRTGNTVYELNAKGVNRWWLHVQSAGADDCADEAECERIARLVAAAPNLLAALKVSTLTPCNCRGCIAGRAAIAKAEARDA